jgi:hypothetical protein
MKQLTLYTLVDAEGTPRTANVFLTRKAAREARLKMPDPKLFRIARTLHAPNWEIIR